ncbi:DUF5714 domain-containing protein [Ruminococcus sp.]|uniref:DUF5714 domain-containing protein n=1 Tax=Ruminococcus sp. TaxID=41978 RepID=UPI0025EC4EDC|nr:DUF5714 domain-containing protein [Ruminococcus sp.]
MATTHKIELKEEVFDQLLEMCISLFRSGQKKDVIAMMEMMMDHPEVPVHYPYHHFILPAALLTAAAMETGEKDEETLREELWTARKRARQVPGGFCGFCGACGAGIGAGIFLSVYTESTPMSVETWQWCNELTGICLKAVSTVAGPRCCKRTCFLSVQAAVPYLEQRLGLHLSMPAEIICKYKDHNPTCKKNACPFYTAE